MRCPFCGDDDSQVKDSRPTEDGAATRRRRQCSACGARFTTFERIQLREITVLKRGDEDGKRCEPFDRAKIEQSVALACRKRDIAPDRIERLVSGIQRQIETAGDLEIASSRIGELVMDGLRQIDTVAYIRFASVYRDFSEAGDFEAFASAVSDAAGDP